MILLPWILCRFNCSPDWPLGGYAGDQISDGASGISSKLAWLFPHLKSQRLSRFQMLSRSFKFVQLIFYDFALTLLLRPKQVCAGLKALKIATSQRHSKNAGLGWSWRSRPPKCGFWSQGLLETPEATGVAPKWPCKSHADRLLWIHCTEDASMPSNDWDKQNPTALGSIGRLPATKWCYPCWKQKQKTP